MNYQDLGQCHYKDTRDPIDEAGKMVGIDLKNPIDLSQMQVHGVSSQPYAEDGDYGRMAMARKATLFAYVFNDHGEQEELTIEFTLKSTRRPKI